MLKPWPRGWTVGTAPLERRYLLLFCCTERVCANLIDRQEFSRNIHQKSTRVGAPGGQLRWVEIRTVAGPLSAVQCVLGGGPYSTASQVRQRQLVCPPPWPRHLSDEDVVRP
jgi:hypothetical protein